jgi:hypothetical protein
LWLLGLIEIAIYFEKATTQQQWSPYRMLHNQQAVLLIPDYDIGMLYGLQGGCTLAELQETTAEEYLQKCLRMLQCADHEEVNLDYR